MNLCTFMSTAFTSLMLYWLENKFLHLLIKEHQYLYCSPKRHTDTLSRICTIKHSIRHITTLNSNSSFHELVKEAFFNKFNTVVICLWSYNNYQDTFLQYFLVILKHRFRITRKFEEMFPLFYMVSDVNKKFQFYWFEHSGINRPLIRV